jgi:hypothetical protein
MADRDLADHARQPDEAEGERGELGPKPDLDQVPGLMDLDRVPGEQAAEEG